MFGVFPDKETLVRAAVEAALDAGPTERALAAIDATLGFEEQLAEAVGILQRRFANIWRPAAGVGGVGPPPAPPQDSRRWWPSSNPRGAASGPTR